MQFSPKTTARRFAGPLTLFAILVITNFNIIFLGQSLVATANSDPLGDEPHVLRPGLFHGGSPSVNWHDVGGVWWQWEPAGKMMSRAFRSGRIPLWDSSVGGGVDSHVNIIQTQYYPPYIALLLAGDTPLLRDYYYLAELYISGLFCYLLLRRNGCHLISALGAGIVYMLSGAMTQTINSSIGQTFAVLPLMVYAADLVLRRCTWRFVGIASLLLALAASSSFLPAVVSGYVLVGFYVLVTLARRPIDWKRALKATSAILLSVLILSFLLIPVELASRQDLTFSHWYSGLGLQHYSPDQMLALISPSVSFDVSQLPNPNRQLFSAPTRWSPFYIGIVPLLLAFLAFGKMDPRVRRLRTYFAVATAFLFLKLIGAIPVQWIGLLPVFRELHFIPYFCGALTFGFAGLAGLGIEGMIAYRSRRVLALGCLAAVGMALCILRFDQTEPLNPGLQNTALWSAIARYGFEIARLALLAGAFLVALFLRARSINGHVAGLLVCVLAAFDLISLDVRQRFLRADIWDNPPPYARFFHADTGKFRVQGATDITLAADVSQSLGIDELSSRMAFNSSRYARIMARYFGAPSLPYPLALKGIPSSRNLLDMLNVKYLLVLSANGSQVQEATNVGLVPAFQSTRYRVFRNPQVWERAYLARGLKAAGTPEHALEELADLHPGDVLFDGQIPQSGSAHARPGTVDHLKYDFDRITARVHATAAGFLVLTENYAPGWQATVNGKRTTIYPANYAFQAIAVPAGDSEILFRYTPPGLLTGIGVSLIAVTVALFMCFGRISVGISGWRKIDR